MVFQNMLRNFYKLIFSILTFGIFYYWGFIYRFNFKEKGYATFLDMQLSIIRNGEIMGLRMFEVIIFISFILLTVCSVWMVITSTTSYLQNKPYVLNNIGIIMNAVAMSVFTYCVIRNYNPTVKFIILISLNLIIDLYTVTLIFKTKSVLKRSQPIVIQK